MVKKFESADHVLKNLTKMITGSQNGDRLIFLFNSRSSDGNKGLGRMDLDLDDERHIRRISATEFKEVVGVFSNGVTSHH
ncbi:hypothetical protein P8452_62632 [Trifolium repens]|jgi:hypothetical protein|nr:hypothetical protein P8452_62632 [Trifolium repens]